jgi:nucleoside 2-deoxyribosyltransferase
MHLASLEDCDFIVAIIDGADADSGTSWEMGYGYAKGKTVISLRTDFRCVGCHELVNLMLEESSVVVRKKEDILKELGSLLFNENG